MPSERIRVGSLGLLAVVVAALLSLVPAATAAAAAGDLDPLFGSGGVSTFTVGGASFITQSMAMGADGRVFFGGTIPGTRSQLGVVALTANGALDTSFNSPSGYVATNVGAGDSGIGFVRPQGDGRVLFAGTSYTSSNDTGSGITVLRLTADGKPDTSFVGQNIYPLPQVYPIALLLQPGGNIIVVGQAISGGNTVYVARLKPNGQFDFTFGTNGSVTLTPPGSSTIWRSAAVASDGSIYTVGFHYDGSTTSFISAKFTAQGVLDTSYGGSGYVIDNIESGDSGLTQAAVQPDGKLVSAGPGHVPNGNGRDTLTVERHNLDGTLDNTFGSGGVLYDTLGAAWESWPSGLAIMPDGRIALIGSSHASVSAAPTYSLVRLSANGTPDSSLGPYGARALALPSTTNVSMRSLALQPDGRIVFGGQGPQPGALVGPYAARVLGDPPPPAPVVLVPVAKVTSPAHSRMRARSLRRFAGRAGPAGQVRRVEIAVQRINSRLLKRRRRCLWMSNSRGRFKSSRASHHKCRPTRWLRARGTTHWSYRLRRHLHRGKYSIFVRVTLKNGVRNSTFSKHSGTLRSFRLR